MSAAPRTSLPARIQEALGSLYDVEAPNVDAFVSATDGRESLELRAVGDAVEIVVHLPRAALRSDSDLSLDSLCQVTEGVSHFLYLAERSRRELPTTQLELEIQAEVDKFVLLSGLLRRVIARPRESPEAITPRRLRAVYERLFCAVSFLHPARSELGHRYRLASRVASRFSRAISQDLLGVSSTQRQLRRRLREFFEAGQREKFELAMA